jgi:integrase
MANIQERRSKDGKLISYSIRVHRGRDAAGKQLKPYSTTFEVPEGWSEQRALKEANKKAVLFEKECHDGLVGDGKQTFQKYAEYVIMLKEKNQKIRTAERYKELLVRINQAIGYMRLVDIRPQHLNAFYDNLSEEGIRNDDRYFCKFDLRQAIKDLGMTKKAFSEMSGLSIAAMDSMRAGNGVRKSSAEAVCKALNRPLKGSFDASNTKGRLSNKTILEHHRLITLIFNQAEKEMLVPYNPARRSTPPKAEKTQANYFQIDDLNRMVDCLEEEPIKFKAIVHLMMLTGCRRGEIFGLKWSKVDLENGILNIDASLIKTKRNGIEDSTTKTSKNRLVPIPPEMVALLKEYRLWQKKEKLANGDRWINTDYVFTNEIGGAMHPDGINAWLIKFSERHGLPHINPHAFRHSYASVLISKGIDIVTVSKTLGHEAVSTTTDIYAEMMKQASEQASETIADALIRNGRKKAK